MGLFSNLPFLKRSQAEATPQPAAPTLEAPPAPVIIEAAAKPVVTVAAPTPMAPEPAEPVISSETRAQAGAVVRRVVNSRDTNLAIAREVLRAQNDLLSA